MATDENNIEELMRNLDSAYHSENAYLDIHRAGDKLVEVAQRGLGPLDEGKLREMLLVPHAKEYWREIHSIEIKNGEIPARPHYCDSDEEYAGWLATASASREEGKKEWIRRALACSAAKRYVEGRNRNAIKELLRAQTKEVGQAADERTIRKVFSLLIGYYKDGANLKFLKPFLIEVLEGRYRPVAHGGIQLFFVDPMDPKGLPIHDDNTCAAINGTIELLGEMAKKEGIESMRDFVPGLSNLSGKEYNIQVPHFGSNGPWWRYPYREAQSSARKLLESFEAMKAKKGGEKNPLAGDGFASEPPRGMKMPQFMREVAKLKH